MFHGHTPGSDRPAGKSNSGRHHPVKRPVANRLRKFLPSIRQSDSTCGESSPESHAPGDTSLIQQTVMRFFEEKDWRFRMDEDSNILQTGVQSRNGSYRCLAAVPNDHIVAFLCLLPMNVPPEKRLLAAEFLTRANYELAIGNFEMDFSDGEIRYKASIDVKGGELTTPMFGSLVHATVATVDRFFPGLMSVLWNGISPERAVAKIERRTSC